MKNFLKKLVLSFLLINLALTIQIAVTQASAPSPTEFLNQIGEGTNLPGFMDEGIHPDAPPDIQPGVATVSSPIYFAIDLFRYVVGTLAFIFIIIAAIKLVTTSNEEEATKAKKNLLIGIIGLLVIQLADTAVKKMFFGEQGEAFEDVGSAQLFAEGTVSQVRGIIGFVEVFLGVVAVLTIVIRAFTLIVSGSSEEEQTKAKSHIIYALVGLAVVGLSEVVVRGFVFPEAGNKLPDVEVGKRIIVSIINFLASFMAILAFLSLFYSGYQYVASGGNEEVNEKVKKHFYSAIIALLLALSAFAIVNTLLQFEDTETNNETFTPSGSP